MNTESIDRVRPQHPRSPVNLTDRIRANIRRLLEAKGLTYGELGFPKNYVSDVVNGVCGVSTERIQEFADRLRVDVTELCRENGP